MFSIPPNVTDAGPDTHDSREEWDYSDWLDEAREEIRIAVRVGKGAERLEAIKRARDHIDTAAVLLEHEILFRWQIIAGDCIIPTEVAPTKEHRADLARDMRALGWKMENGRYVRPEPPLMRGKP